MNLPCGIILDLIPLVRDGVADKESAAAVQEHLLTCDACRCEFEGQPALPTETPNDKKIISAIRKSLLRLGILVLCAGSLMGIFMSNSMNMFYNILIMPGMGMLSYALLKRRSFYVPPGIFIFSYLFILFSSWIDGGFEPLAFGYSIPYAVIYMLLAAAGIAVAALLKFAFGKDETSI